MSMIHHLYSGQNAEKVFSTHDSYKIPFIRQVKLEKPVGFFETHILELYRSKTF